MICWQPGGGDSVDDAGAKLTGADPEVRQCSSGRYLIQQYIVVRGLSSRRRARNTKATTQ